MIGRKVSVLAAAMAVLVSSAVGATVLSDSGAAAQYEEEALVEDEHQMTLEDADEAEGFSDLGVGETLLLVVAAQLPTEAQALTALGEVNSRFGDLEGFSIDATDNYEVLGALVQSSPDTVTVSCDKVGGVIGFVPVVLDCPDLVTTVQQFEPVTLEHVAADALDSFAFSSACGGNGLVPCQQARYRELLGDNNALSPDQWLLVTAFRTKRGAEEFVELARAADVPDIVVLQARKLGGGDIGLGQEPHPDGSGPLLGPLPDQELYQS